MMGQVVRSLYYLDPTVIPRLKSLRSGDDPVFSFGVLFYALKRNPRRVVQHVDDAAPFKSVFLDQMLHDLIVRMRIDAQVRDLCPAVINDLGEKSGGQGRGVGHHHQYGGGVHGLHAGLFGPPGTDPAGAGV